METNTQGHLSGQTLTYGDITRDPAKLPAASVSALLARGFSHFLGNEQASKIVARIRKAIVDERVAQAGDDAEAVKLAKSEPTKESVKAFREANEDLVATWGNEAREEALKSLDEGTIGTQSTRGPAKSPLDSEMSRIAKSEIQVILQSNGLKFPTKDQTVALGGESFTAGQLVERRLAKHADRIKKEAEKVLADAARKAKKVLEASAEGLDL